MKTVGKFKVLEKLGSGGMGDVYKALDTRLQRLVALKFLSGDASHDTEARQRQLREARAAGALNHSHIATVYEIGESGNQDFIAMEYVDGVTLFDAVRGNPAPLSQALDWSIQLCGAIEAAHERGIIHRDIKSTNIMITTDLNVKVLDFGLAYGGVDDDPSGGDRITRAGAMVGTLEYMAPEVIQGEPATSRSDVFSLGVVVYEMLTGKPPFQGDFPAQVVYTIVNVDPKPVSDLRRDVPLRLEEIVNRALEKDPERRIKTAGEMVSALREIALDSDPAASGSHDKLARVIPTNLPARTTRFIGRETELSDLEKRLGENRVVTLTGPGGAGKTRMSLELAERTLDRFTDGVFLVELAPLTEPTQVIRAIGRVLGVREESGRELIESLIEHIENQRMLLVLDNCEHLVDASAGAANRLLEASAELKIVATSQERLGIPGEMVWQLSSLSLPPDDFRTVEELSGYESVKLFMDRAVQVNPDVVLDEANASAVAQICRRLGGIPLAIELAAARVRVLTPETILSRLEDRFRLLTSGSRTSLPRQQTLRATVEWSLDLLGESERRLFRTLSVFSGGMGLEAVETVCEVTCSECDDVLDLLGRLVDKSLVVARQGAEGEPRYVMLETLRVYGQDELVRSGDEPQARERHAQFYLDLAEAASGHLTGPDQVKWFNRLDEDTENIRSAVLWLYRSLTPERALRIGAAIWRFWSVRGYLESGRDLLGLMLGAAKEDTEIRARALYGAGVLAMDQADYETAEAHFEKCVSIRRALGDKRGEAQALNSIGMAARERGDYETARRFLRRGLDINREAGHLAGSAMSIHALGITSHREGDLEAALSLFEEGLNIREQLGDMRGIAALKAHLGSVYHDGGRYDEAEPLLNEGLAGFRELGNKRGIAYALMYLGGVAMHRGQFDRARSSLLECLAISHGLGDRQHVVMSLEWLAMLASAKRDFARALRLEGAASALREKYGTPRNPIQTRMLDRSMRDAREELGDTAVELAFAEGKTEDLSGAIRLAHG